MGVAPMPVPLALGLLMFLSSSVARGFDVGGDRDLITRPVWWHAPFFSGSGYGFEAISHVMGLRKTGLVGKDSLWITHHGDNNEESLEVVARMGLTKRKDLLEMAHLGFAEAAMQDRSAIIICHSVPADWAAPEPASRYTGTVCPQYPIPEATYVIGRTMWETDLLPPDLAERCNYMHEIWVPCEHNREVYTRSGVVGPELVVMPGAVDVDALDPTTHTPLPLPLGKRVFGRQRAVDGGTPPFAFVSLFDWGMRKGWDVLLRAYLEEFRADGVGGSDRGGSRQQRDVMLVLSTKVSPSISPEPPDFVALLHSWVTTHMPHLASQLEEELPAVYVSSEHLSDEGLARLYRAAGAFVLPSRGEGWGRPVMEAMAMAVPVIATNWSGLTEFLDESVGYPLAIDGLEAVPAQQGLYSSAQQKWAAPSPHHLRQLMRHVVEHPQEAAERGAAARARVLERYTPEAVGRLVAARLRTINEKLQSSRQPT